MARAIEKYRYVEPQDFTDFKKNTDSLIEILNHSMTELRIDVSWIKKLLTWQMGMFSALIVAVIIGGIKWLGA